MRHINIPIFIPHLGCPNQCIFCNQRYISGTVQFDESIVDIEINKVLSTVNEGDECEIAFFGGSFTGIERGLMISLLDRAQKYVDTKRVVGIRMSTRPDYISQEILDILKNYTITYIELGIQTMNDDVLSYLKRGHTVKDTYNAIELIKINGLKFIGQMMIGLPQATIQDELLCAESICNLGASGARIYPTLIFRNTELEELTVCGEYSPLSLESAIERSALVLKKFSDYNVPCIRIGLCDSENLHSDKTFVAGPNSPNIGEMIKSRMLYHSIVEKIKIYNICTDGLTLHIKCAKGQVSQVVGNKRRNLVELKERFNFNIIKVIEDVMLCHNNIKIEIKEENSCV